MKRTCKNCHFLSVVKIESKEWKKLLLNKESRKLVGERKTEWLRVGYRTILCWHNVWDEKILSSEKITEQVNRERANTCFWWTYTEGMGPDAAFTLRNREEDREKLKDSIERSTKAYKLAFWTLMVTLTALLLNLHDLFVKVASPATLF